VATKQSRDVLDWLRSYASTKFSSLGLATDSSNMNVPLTNDARVQSAIDYLTQRELELWAAWTPALEAFWGSASDEVWTEIEAQMPTTVRNQWNVLWTDTDPNVKALLKLLSRVLCLATQSVRGAG
jgi:hypothetical protein